MVPLVLHIKNFLSYGPLVQTVSFEEHHLICLSGNNGNGKSALLEAITWSIWGQARRIHGVTKDDTALVHMGERDMYVSLEFLMNGVRYLIKRSCSVRGKKSNTELVFGVCDHQGILTKSLTENTQRDTQERINTILGLDYETFINSVFLKQGQSNEFSKKNPKERKEVLGKILGINLLEKMRRHILEDLKTSSQSIELYEQQEEILKKQVSLPEELKVWHDSLFQKRDEYAQEKNVYSKLKEREEIYILKLAQVHEERIKCYQESIQIETTQKILEKEIFSFIEVHRALRVVLHTLSKMLGHTFVSLKDVYLAIQQRRRDLQGFLHTSEDLKKKLFERKLFLYEEYNVKMLALNKKLQEHLNIKNALDKDISNKHDQGNSLIKEFEFVRAQQDVLQNKKREKEKEIEDLEFLRVRVDRQLHTLSFLKARVSLLSAHYEAAVALLTLYENHQISQCPTCGAEVSEFKKEECRKLLELKKEKLSLILEKRKKWLSLFDNSLRTLKEKTMGLKVLEEEKLHIKTILEKNEIILKELPEKIHVLKEEVACLGDSLGKMQGISINIQRDLERLGAQREQAYQEDELYKELETNVSELDQYRDLAFRLDEQSSLLHPYMRDFAEYTLIEAPIKIRNKFKELRETKKREIFKQLQELDGEIENIKKEQAMLSKEREEMHEKLLSTHQVLAQEYAQYKSREERQLQIKQELGVLHEKLTALKQETKGKTELALMLSKDGLQAALIEQVVPEIEREANDLLDKLSDGQARIAIDSIRDLKSGKTKETLDIVIADSLGTRPYEFFSGGEAFRIDLALRIALAKTLARRSGSVLQTLIIDEGFGSQDAGALEAIVHALQRIKEDFQKIIIVSHLSSFKEHFPTHFIVQKTVQGSVVRVFQQG